MDKIIATIDQHDIDPTAQTSQRSTYRVRTAVRAVMADQDGRIALMYAGKKKYYKLPGGGVDEGEDLDIALERELIEETGSKAKVTEDLGQVIEWRDYATLHQLSYAYRASLIGEPGMPDFTQHEIDEGFEMRWADSLDQAATLIDANTSSDDLDVRFMSLRDAAILRSAK
jgi:8-oxo-dGTP diphosphatase